MAHSVGEQAARAVKNSERKAAVETRTPAEILKGIRGNLAAHLAVTPSDIQFLLSQYDVAQAQYDAAVQILTARNHEISGLQEQIDQFRAVYEQENRSTTVKVERGIDPNQDGIEAEAENGV